MVFNVCLYVSLLLMRDTRRPNLVPLYQDILQSLFIMEFTNCFKYFEHGHFYFKYSSSFLFIQLPKLDIFHYNIKIVKSLAHHNLQIRSIKLSDAGDYQCKIHVLGDPIVVIHTLEILGKLTLFFHESCESFL